MLYIINKNGTFPVFTGEGEVDDGYLSLLRATPVCTVRSFLQSVDKLPIHPDFKDKTFVVNNLKTWSDFLAGKIEMYQEDFIDEIENILQRFEDMGVKNGIPDDPILYAYDEERKVFTMNSEFIDGAIYGDITIATMITAVQTIFAGIACGLVKTGTKPVGSIDTCDSKFNRFDSIRVKTALPSKIGPLIDLEYLCHSIQDFESRDLKKVPTNYRFCFVQDDDDFRWAIKEFNV